MIAKVEPLTTARALRGPFDYLVGDDVAIGSVLVVPFANRRLLGVVTGLSETSDVAPDMLAVPLEVLEQSIPPALVALGEWVAREYVSTPARGLGLVLAPGTGTGAGRRTVPRRSLVAQRTRAGDAAVDGEGRLGGRQRAALTALAEGPRRASELARDTGCDHAGLRRLQQRGLIELEMSVEPPRRPTVRRIGAPSGEQQLTAAQGAALQGIRARMGEDHPEPLLLHGVTGSGKTEVYLRAVARALETGSAIVLVPEIALTPQTASRFIERFGDAVAILHSQLSQRERFDEWSRLRAGDARVCVGPRSAVFAPLDDLRLIVVDEEHDGSYKQEGDPRYDARAVAERRARNEGALLLAGSATPRPESFAAWERIELPDRVDGHGLPAVEVVGMAGVRGALHERTRDSLDEVRRAGGKAIVLLNRRGWSNFLTCGSCGRVWECPACDVTLVLHRAGRFVACHHCGHREPMPSSCPDCGSVSIARHGVGTEQLDAELAQMLAPLPVFRLDTDIAARDGVEAVLERFQAAAAGVLVGTQMVAKGHDFPDVRLGVVLDADATLRFPDMRAEERTFALVAQLAGRSGRGASGGKVVVQALEPEARPLVHATRHDATRFLEGELERREALRYPPFGHLIRIVCSSPESGPETTAAAAVRGRLQTAGVASLGPAPLFRRKGSDRSQLVVKAAVDARDRVIAAVRGAVEEVVAGGEHRGVAFAVDVDPQ